MAKNIKSVIHGYSRQKEEEQAKLLASDSHLPYVNLVNYPFTGDVLGLIKEEDAKKYRVLAFQRLGNTVRVATPMPHSQGLAEVMNETGKRNNIHFEPYVCSQSSVSFGLEQYAKLVRSSTITAATAKKQTVAHFMEEVSNVQDLEKVFKRVSTTELFELILSGALAFDATDIHLEPQSDNVRIRFRVDGDLLDISQVSSDAYHLLSSRIKNLAGLKLNKLTTAQDGRFSITANQDKIDVRVNVLPATYGETIELRLLTGKGLMELDALGLNADTKAAIDRHINQESGLIIVTGPTGSGKTTTLYAILKLLNKPEKKIITIEDPVEYKVPGIEQIQVDPEKGFDFAQALRAILRQDPDIILVGEIRDKETAEIAINASLTGHLVLTTLHTNSAPATFSRLVEMGVTPHLLTDAISLIIAQRLVKRVCPDCSGQGCDKCHFTGGRGRVVISEFIEPTSELDELVKNKASISQLTELAVKLGYKPMSEDLNDKTAKGIVFGQQTEA